MEVLILLAASFLAVADTFTGTLDCQNVPLVAPFTRADEGAPLILILVSEASSPTDLNDDDFLDELLVVQGERSSNEGLEAITWELDSRIFLNFAFF